MLWYFIRLPRGLSGTSNQRPLSVNLEFKLLPAVYILVYSSVVDHTAVTLQCIQQYCSSNTRCIYPSATTNILQQLTRAVQAAITFMRRQSSAGHCWASGPACLCLNRLSKLCRRDCLCRSCAVAVVAGILGPAL